MGDREKVIKGLESLRDICNAKSDMAIGEGRTAWAGYASVVHLAIDLLREQEPRPLTKRQAYQWMREDRPFFTEVNLAFAGVWLTPHNYGIDWRCWPYRPTEEQREATPWARKGGADGGTAD